MRVLWVVGVLALGMAPARADKKEDCTVATKGDSPVAKACADGGRDAAKKTMKELVKAANKKGGSFKCPMCHVDTKNFELRDNAPDDFKKLLDTAK